MIGRLLAILACVGLVLAPCEAQRWPGRAPGFRPGLQFGVAQAWTPAALGSALSGWFDASDNSTMTFSGSNVSSWRNKGAPGGTATANGQPAYSATIFNGKPAITVGSNYSYLKLPYTAGFPAGSDGSSLYYAGILGQDNYIATVAAAGDRTLGRISSYFSSIRTGSDQQGSILTSTSGNVAGWVLQSGASPSSSLYLDGAVASTVNRTTFTTATSDNFVLGTNTNGATTSQIGEVVYVNRALTVAERQKLEGYLAWHWGLQANLPAGHPYKSSAPTAANDASAPWWMRSATPALLAANDNRWRFVA